MDRQDDLLLACRPAALGACGARSHFARAEELLVRRALEARPLERGWEFAFGPDDFAALASFVDGERRCCPFLSFVLAVAAGDGRITLRMEGPDGTRELLQRELLR